MLNIKDLQKEFWSRQGEDEKFYESAVKKTAGENRDNEGIGLGENRCAKIIADER